MKRHRGTRGNVPGYCPSADLNRIKRRAFERRNPPRIQRFTQPVTNAITTARIVVRDTLDEAREPLQIWPKVKEPNTWQIIVRFVKIAARRCFAAVFKREAL